VACAPADRLAEDIGEPAAANRATSSSATSVDRSLPTVSDQALQTSRLSLVPVAAVLLAVLAFGPPVRQAVPAGENRV